MQMPLIDLMVLARNIECIWDPDTYSGRVKLAYMVVRVKDYPYFEQKFFKNHVYNICREYIHNVL